MADVALTPAQQFEKTDAARAAAIDAEQAAADKRYTAFDTAEQARLSQQGEEIGTMRGAIDRGMDEEAKLAAQRPAPVEKPQPPTGPVVNPKDFEGLSYALIGMALIGGAASKGNWLGVSATLNGALKGFQEGSQQRAEKEYQDYQTQFNAAMQKEAEAEKEYEHILTDKRQTINEMLSKLQLAGVQYGHDDVAAAARLRSIDRAQQQVEAHRQSRFQAQEHFDTVNLQVNALMERAKMTAGGGGMKGLNDYGKWFVEQRTVAGDTSAFKAVQSRYGGAFAADMFNEMGKYYSQQGLDPREATAAQQELVAQQAAHRVAVVRMQGVERLTLAIKPLEERVRQLVREVNGSGVMTWNDFMNRVKTQFGDSKLAELRTLMGSVGRQYIEAITMPGSNAQLHATSQDWADSTFNVNANQGTIDGVLAGMNKEISATHGALQQQVKEGRQAVLHSGPTLPSPGGAAINAAPAPTQAAPMSLDDYLKSQGY